MPDSYRLVVPSEGSVVTDCPPGHVAVYTHHFEFGLRFPLDSFLVDILKAFNVCLAQLTPLAIRNIIAYIWVVRFLDFPQTLNLFRHLHWLKKNGSSRLAGWWSIMTADKKMTVQPKMTSLKGWQDAFFWVRVPDDFPVRRHFTEPAPHMELLPLKPLTKEELVAYDYFASADYDTTYDDGKTVRTKEPSTWLPHTKYILGDRPLSALLLSPAYENGLDHLDLDALGVDSEHRPLTHLPAPPSSDYLTMHSSTNGRRGGNRHGPQNLRRRGRGASTSVRVPIAAATSNAPPSPAVPLRSSATRTVNRGAINRRRTREPTVDDSAANKRQATEEPGASAANEVVQVEDLDPNTSEGIQGEGGLDAGLGNAGGTSLLSRSTSQP
ncbi:uncharacterized protein LOC130591335 [Beta vulgaris subsp. vulgaris]|uniref:uncharacterized protein LOC130591335 n=1 Tax=Beta vulgaris subsp. vulgaris TaxID=3555 RepID=UPI002546D16F|nr:uncharacterized protein LOC130591335 [Beta vulgaris subsp. vulgaris]